MQNSLIISTIVDQEHEVIPKLTKVLNKLLQPNLKLHNDDFLNLLFTHLTDPKDGALEQATIKQLLFVWLREAVQGLENRTNTPNPNILAFVLNVSKYVSASEELFVKLNSENTFERLITAVNGIPQPTVTVSLIKLLSGFLEHKSGLQWVISTNHWELLLNIVSNNETVYVSKECYKVLVKLLEKSIHFNAAFCNTLIQRIIAPLDETINVRLENAADQSQAKKLSNTLQLLVDILYSLLLESEKQNANSILELFLSNFRLEERIKTLIRQTSNSELKGDLFKIKICLFLHGYKDKFAGHKVVLLSKIEKMTNVLTDTFYEAATEVSAMCTLQLIEKLLHTWSILRDSLPKCIGSNQQEVTLEDQMLLLQMAPVFTVFLKIIGEEVYGDRNEDDFRYKFVCDLIAKIEPRTFRVDFKWLQYLNDNYSISNGILALNFMIHCTKFYTKENAALAFQMLNYMLEDLNHNMRKMPHVHMEFSREPDYLALHLKMMEIIIEEFDLKWKDSVEALSVVNLVYDLLDGHVWQTKIVVNALKLAEKGISKYMTFQMALLIDDTENSVMNVFVPFLYVKLHDGNWEVRDSAVELIHQLLKTANRSSFTSYQSLMVKNEFPAAMMRMATSDGNSFVRASALKCLQEMVKVEVFWEVITSTCNIFETILTILQSETEGVVRSEGPLLVDCIYEYHQIPDEHSNIFYDAMSHAVEADLHWEVRVNALKFWKRVIDNCLTQQGMIDGSFPSVTFSKQLKKIVTLSPVEVRKRLVAVLLELSHCGCLSVFYEAIRDECDLEVSRIATEYISHFVGLLKKNAVSAECLDQTTVEEKPEGHPVFPENPVNSEIPDAPSGTPSDVIDEILDSRDLNLLESVYNTLDIPMAESIEIKRRTVLAPRDFLNLVYGDLEGRLDDKIKVVQGLDNFQSLLDDILKEYEPTDVNNMDCY